jgi:hypothetical protein
MLWEASAINGYSIEASDGGVGSDSDMLFEDVGWVIRWLVVDTGNWLSGRNVFLRLSALGQPNLALRHFPVKRTMQRVKDSPDVDTDQPVSRQIEAHVHNYYGWDPDWNGGYFPIDSGMATPFVAPLHGSGSKPRDPGRADAHTKKGDPHLRSIAAVTGYHIRASASS